MYNYDAEVPMFGYVQRQRSHWFIADAPTLRCSILKKGFLPCNFFSLTFPLTLHNNRKKNMNADSDLLYIQLGIPTTS